MSLRATYGSQHWIPKGATTLAMSKKEICGISLPGTLTRCRALVPAAASSSSSSMTATSVKTLPFYFRTGLVGQPYRPMRIVE